MSNFQKTTAAAIEQAAFPSPAERERIVEELASIHNFPLDELLAWPDRLMNAAWWKEAAASTDMLAYPPAMDYYLADMWTSAEYPMPFAAQMASLTEALFRARDVRYSGVFLYGQQIHEVHDWILMLLDSQVERLRIVHRLDQDALADFPAAPGPMAHLVADCETAPTAWDFGRWVLDTWLPAHIRANAAGAVAKVEAEKPKPLPPADDDARRFHAGAPGMTP